MTKGSKIFIPNRALGYVSNHIPLQVRYIKSRKENLITTCVGKSFHTYGISHFTLLSVSGLHSEDITCMSSDVYHVYTSCENIIYAWRRGTELKHTYRGHRKEVILMLPFGAHLISIDESSCVKVWDIKTEELFLELTFSNETFKISAIMHPNTYINKVLFGSEQGQLQLWNIKTSKLIYTFKGWDSAITCLVQAPAIDVAGIGLANGKIILHNLKFDETVMEFMQDWGYVTAISFRTDDFPIMATGSVTGHIVFWNLEEKKVDTQLMAAHNGSVTGMYCLPNEPLLVTSSPDNTLKLWIFDMTDGGARLLRIREGHSSNPTFVRFHGANGHNILSAAHDSTLRIFNTRTETFNKSLGKASYNRKASKKRGRTEDDPLKMPPIVEFTSETSREKEWDNIAAVHLGIPTVTTWSYDKIKMGDLKLLPERFEKKKKDINSNISATCLCLTHCGNFVIIGYSTGHVDRFNIQSGQHRAQYGQPKAHNSPVRGVATDSLNHVTITAGSDGTVKFWDFKYKGNKPLTTLNLEEQISFLRTHHESSMIALALEDFSLQILDLDTRTIIRKYTGHNGQITDATFNPDSRWITTSSMDCTIKTWNIPTGQLIDQFRLKSPCISLNFSPTGEILATAHVDYLGIFLWSNKTLYANITLKSISENDEIPLIELPDCAQESNDSDTEEDFDLNEYKSPEQLENLISFSLISNSRWQNLLNLELIKKRNKPKMAPKKNTQAPFFLPTIPSLSLQFDLSSETEKNDTKLLKSNLFSELSPFGKLLLSTKDTNDFTLVVEKLKSMGPSMIDFEVRSLSSETLGSIEVMLQFLKCVESMFLSNKDFELAQAYLGVFLKAHGNIIAKEDKLRVFLSEIEKCQNFGWRKLQDKLLYNLCVVQTLRIM